MTKNTLLRVEKKIKKIKNARRTPHSRQPAAKSPHTKAQQAAGMRECNRSATSKKSIRGKINERNKIKERVLK